MLAVALAAPAHADVVELATGGVAAAAVAPQVVEAAGGSVTVPTGMRTTAGIRAKRYKGTTQDGRPAYFARVPLKAPAAVQNAVIAANKIVGLPYKYGGGHARVQDSGYDCSGTVSYALIGAQLLDAPLSSYEFDDLWKAAEPGAGSWISVYGNQSHAFAVIAGLRLDTSTAADSSGVRGPQWRPNSRRDHSSFAVVHPPGL